jgi:hypothetical protein
MNLIVLTIMRITTTFRISAVSTPSKALILLPFITFTSQPKSITLKGEELRPIFQRIRIWSWQWKKQTIETDQIPEKQHHPNRPSLHTVKIRREENLRTYNQFRRKPEKEGRSKMGRLKNWSQLLQNRPFKESEEFHAPDPNSKTNGGAKQVTLEATVKHLLRALFEKEDLNVSRLTIDSWQSSRDAWATLSNEDEEEDVQELLAHEMSFARATYKQALEEFRTLTIDQSLNNDRHSEMYLTDSAFLAPFTASFASQTDHDTPVSPKYVICFLCDHLLTGEPVFLSFPWDPDANTLWRNTHLGQE